MPVPDSDRINFAAEGLPILPCGRDQILGRNVVDMRRVYEVAPVKCQPIIVPTKSADLNSQLVRSIPFHLNSLRSK
jgi:hypothetical protein